MCGALFTRRMALTSPTDAATNASTASSGTRWRQWPGPAYDISASLQVIAREGGASLRAQHVIRSLMGAALFMGGVLAATAPVSGAAGHRSSRPSRVVSMTFVNAAGARYVYWFSGDGTTGVVTATAASGVEEGAERLAYRVVGRDLERMDTTVYPGSELWASDTILSGCSGACYDNIWLFPSPSEIKRLLSDHQLVATSHHERLDGRQVLEVGSPVLGEPARIELGTAQWIDPSSDEIVQADLLPHRPYTYQWLPATAGNLAHLELPVPAGYTRAPDSCAAAAVPSDQSPC